MEAFVRAFSTHEQTEWALEFRDFLLTRPSASPTPDVFVLTGDAGAGKSRSLQLLSAALDEVGWEHMMTMTSTTNVAASVNNARTFHSELRINSPELLNDALDCASFAGKWRARNREQLETVEESRRAGCGRHKRLDLYCAACCAGAPAGQGKTFRAAYAPLLVIDEYGMMSARWFEKCLLCLAALAPPGQSHVVLLVGSVTQLPPATDGVSARDGVWTSERLRALYRGGTDLCLSVRQCADQEYASVLGLMQFNVATALTRRVIEPLVSREAEARYADCTFMPHAVRLVHSNVRRDSYLSNVIATAKSKGLPLYATAPKLSYRTRPKQKKFLNADRQMLLNRFKAMNGFAPMTFARDQLVRVLPGPWSANRGGASIATLVSMSSDGQSATVRYGGEADGESAVTAQSVSQGQVTAHFLPLVPANAINTYACQGLTLDCDVIYAPPLGYGSSPLKASAYVVCSRVPDKRRLVLTNCAFLSSVGSFFQQDVIDYKCVYELGYRPQQQQQQQQ